MSYILLRIIIVVLYLVGPVPVYLGYVAPWIAIAIYVLVLLVHIVHLARYKKESPHKLGPVLVLDILVFGMIPILEANRKSG